MMIRPAFLLSVMLLVLVLPGCGPSGNEGVRTFELRPHEFQPGKTVRMTAETVCEGGALRLEGGDGTKSGSMSFTRSRVIEFTAQDEGGSTLLVNVARNRSDIEVTWDGTKEKSVENSALKGVGLLATKGPSGWEIAPKDGSNPKPAQLAEINDLVAYENGNYLPGAPVAIGDTWEFEPSFIRHVLGREVLVESIVGSMKLNSVEGDLAYIDVNIGGSGREETIDEREKSAGIHFKGNLVFNLATHLDERMELKGNFLSRSNSRDGAVTGSLPVTISVRKEIVP